MIGLCKFFDLAKGIGTQMVVAYLKSKFNLDVTTDVICAAARLFT